MAKSRRNQPSSSSIRRGAAARGVQRLPPGASRDTILSAWNRAQMQGVTQKEFERDALGIKNPTGRYLRLIIEGKRSGGNIEAEGRSSIGVRNKVQVTFKGPNGRRVSAVLTLTKGRISRLDLPSLRLYLQEHPEVFDEVFDDLDRRYATREFDEDSWDREDFDLHYVTGLSEARTFYNVEADLL